MTANAFQSKPVSITFTRFAARIAALLLIAFAPLALLARGLAPMLPTGDLLLIQLSGERDGTLILLDTARDLPLLLREGAGVYNAYGEWSPDGSSIAYPDLQERTYLLDVTTMQDRILYSCATVCPLQWSADGSHYLYQRGYPDWIVSDLAGNQRQLNIQWGRWSPQGAQLAYADMSDPASQRLYLWDAALDQTYEIGPCVPCGLSWSPDQRQLIYNNDFSSTLVTLGDPIRHDPLPYQISSNIEWSQDGEWLTFSVDEGARQMVVNTHDVTDAYPLELPVTAYRHRWIENRLLVAALENGSFTDLFLHTPHGEYINLTQTPRTGEYLVSVSPDQQLMLVESQSASGTQTLSLLTLGRDQSPETLAVPPWTLELSLFWSPDSQALVINSDSQRVDSWHFDTGAEYHTASGRELVTWGDGWRDGTILITSTDSNGARLYALDTRSGTRTLLYHTSPLVDVAGAYWQPRP